MSQRAIAVELGVSPDTIRKDYAALGLTPPPRGRRTGTQLSDETRDRMAESGRRYWSSEAGRRERGRRSEALRTAPPVDRICEHCGRGFQLSTKRARQEPGRFCSSDCLHEWRAAHDPRRLDALRAGRRRWRERVVREVQSTGHLSSAQAANQLGVSSVSFHVARGRIAVQRVHGFTLVAPATITGLKRDLALELKCVRDGQSGDHRRLQWLDSDFVVSWMDRRGWTEARARKHRLSRDQVAALVRDAVEARRRLTLPHAAGRRRADGPPAHHLEWLAAFLDVRDYYERRACIDEPAPSVWRMCLEVALEDFADHPGRWSYDPVSMNREAAARVSKAIKPLLIARTEIVTA